MDEIKRHRIQFTESELSTLLYHMNMELDSLRDVYLSLRDKEEDHEEMMLTLREFETLSKIKQKLQRRYEK